jgi:hypothetical protein
LFALSVQPNERGEILDRIVRRFGHDRREQGLRRRAAEPAAVAVGRRMCDVMRRSQPPLRLSTAMVPELREARMLLSGRRPISRRRVTARLRAGELGPKLRSRFADHEPDSNTAADTRSQ